MPKIMMQSKLDMQICELTVATHFLDFPGVIQHKMLRPFFSRLAS